MILVSACLAGIPSRYDGTDAREESLADLVEKGLAIAFCPETAGGLEVPREPCEIVREGRCRRVIGRSGTDHTESFTAGALKALELCERHGIRKAVLKARSPSCGCGSIYDGSFTGTLTEGNGFTAEVLLGRGIEIKNEHDWEGAW